MVSVLIFTLLDVIWNVEASFRMTHNGNSHTSPLTSQEIKLLREYLRNNSIQTYQTERDGADAVKPVRDLFTQGVAYVHTASAFKNFRPVVSNATYRDDTGDANEEIDQDDGDKEGEDEAADVNLDIVEMDDILIDEEEFSSDIDIAQTISNMRELVHNVMDA